MRPVVISVGPLAAADDNGIAESQTPAGAGALILDGALTDFAPDNIAAAQTLAGAEDLVLTDSTVYLAGNQYVVITAVDDETGVDFTISGIALGGIGVTEVLAGPNAGSVVSTKQYSQILSISSSAATADDVEVGTWSAATLDEARRVLFTFAGADAGKTLTITGTDRYGNPISEDVAGASTGTSSTVQDFKTVTSISISAAAAGAIIVGTSAVAGSDWVRFDDWTQNMLSIQADVSGTVNYTIQSTLDDPNSPTDPVAVPSITWFSSNDTNLVGQTVARQSNTQIMPTYARILLNSGSGSVRATFTQFSQGAF
ncbi:MAG: hypothetical protein ACR2IJ_02940 [Fluviibacter sp.]